MESPQLETIVDTYLADEISHDHSVRIENAADQLASNGSDAFRQGFELQVAGVPVAAAHTKFVEHSLSRLAVQSARAPSLPAVAMSLNYLESDDSMRARVDESVELVRRFQEYHPHLSLSYFVAGYKEGASISEIRDGIFGGATVLHKHQKEAVRQPLTDLIFTNWDIDTRDATPTYFAQTQRSYAQKNHPTWMSFPNTQHTRLGPEFANANRLLAWYDLNLRAGRAGVPAHFSTNLLSWALGGGYRNINYGEVGELVSRVEAATGETVPCSYLPAAVVRVSPHRLIGSMAAEDKVEYGALKVRRANAGDSGVINLEEDFTPEVFNKGIVKLVDSVANGAFAGRVKILERSGVSPQEAKERAIPYAIACLRVGAALIGRVHETADAVDKNIASLRARAAYPYN